MPYIVDSHHITMSVNGAQEDVDFHVQVLGLRLIKRTVLFDGTIPIYHLYYSNADGDPSAVLTTFPFGQAGIYGRRGSYVDKMREIGPECDFVTDIAADFPLYVILFLLGLPESDFPRMRTLTQEMFGRDDAEHQRGPEPEAWIAAMQDFLNYFDTLTASRRRKPAADLVSAIANGRIDGEPLSDMDTASYYVTIASAGHDTTKDAICGGLCALIENPGELGRLKQDLTLMPTALEEMIRWTTPVKEVMRTATADTTVRGVDIAAGESVYLAYASANRDEEVFDDPFRFDVGRAPNKHLAFGYGVHLCPGAALARMEIGSLYFELLPRLGSIELAGKPELSATTFVGGFKHLPIRHSLK